MGLHTITLTVTDNGGATGTDVVVVTVNAGSAMLTVAGTGTGSGTVTSSLAGIDCTITDGGASGDCTQSYQQGTAVVLTATASATGGVHQFDGWSGVGISCPGTAPCNIAMDNNRTVMAQFTEFHSLTVTGAGDGDGTVTGGNGINCSISSGATQGSCSALFAEGVVTSLSASTTTAYDFAGWSGACTGTGDCQVNMTQARTVTADFVVLLPDLTIVSGTPSANPSTVVRGGTVQLSSWTVENQGNEVSGSFSNGFYLSTDAIITAEDTYLSGNNNASLAPGEQSNWSGPTLTIPIGTAPGSYYVGVLVDRTDAVGESSESNNYVSTPITVLNHLASLTVSISGIGSVSSEGVTPAINCSYIEGQCTETYPRGTVVTLNASTEHPDFAWEDWSGTGSGFTCTTATTCDVLMDQDRTVTARFSPPGSIDVTANTASFTMPVGGPATPSSETLTVYHTGGGGRTVYLYDLLITYDPVDVTPWLDANMSSLVIDSLNPATLTLSVNASANNLGIGVYTAQVILRDFYNFKTVDVTLTVGNPPPVMSNVNHSLIELNDELRCTLSSPPASSFEVTFDYSDPNGNGPTNISQARLRIDYVFQSSGSGTFNNYTYRSSLSGDGYSGTATTTQCYRFGTNSYVDVTMSIEDAGGARSAEVTHRITKPNGSN